MFIVMHCGGMPFDGSTIKKQSLGGSETAAYYVARELARRGHKVTLFTNQPTESEADGVAYRYSGRLTEVTPLGDRYHTYAVATPHDVNITQRHPAAFHIPTAAKLNLWWLHDVPLPDLKGAVTGNMLRTDGVLCVSAWHRQQVIDVWGVRPERAFNIGNGVDLNLFDSVNMVGDPPKPQVSQKIAGLAAGEPAGAYRLLYSSRPERGLETLVKPGGIMERLVELEPLAHLYVCGYDNVTAPMQDYYAWLEARCDKLPNVTHLGALTKPDLAAVMRSCDLLAYPTVFSETSCITAMEAQAAGLPFLSSYCGALPETCLDSGSVLLPLQANTDYRPGAMEAGDPSVEVDIEGFTDAIVQLARAPEEELQAMADAQRKAARRHTWAAAVDQLEAVAGELFEQSSAAICRGLMRNSDIYALTDYVGEQPIQTAGTIVNSTDDELSECYGFINTVDWSEHYREYYAYEKARGVDYGPEDLANNARFEYVASVLSRLPAGSRVLDYGCAHGHYTVNLAKRLPGLQFVGVDITESNIRTARKWVEDEGLDNVRFEVGQLVGDRIVTSSDEILDEPLDAPLIEWAPQPVQDCIIAAEVLEHVAEPWRYVDGLSQYLKPDGLFLITTPYGPWEAIGYNQHWPWRAHVHHFERADLHELWGHNPGFAVTVISSGRSPDGEPIGSYVTQFRKPSAPSGRIDYSRKLAQLAPRQTVSVCMIVRDAEATIRRCLESVAPIADEFVIRLDNETKDGTLAAINRALGEFAPHKPVLIMYGDSPTVIGFDQARNAAIGEASGDWILWVDADEVLDGAEHLQPFLRSNQFDAYSVAHHHFSIEPAGVLKTDYPARLFRNRRGIQFYGVVHEHPETALNKSIDYTAILPGVAIAHTGYTNEVVRRARFDRNYPLMLRDREKYPGRLLGKFLWLRDLFQLTRYELERGGLITPEMVARAREGVQLWADLVDSRHTRLAAESLEWYTGMVELLGGGKKLELSVNGQQVAATFQSRQHVDKMVALLLDGV